MAFSSNGGGGGTPNPSMITGLDNSGWVKKFTVGQRAAVKTGLKEESADTPGQRIGSQDTSQPDHG